MTFTISQPYSKSIFSSDWGEKISRLGRTQLYGLVDAYLRGDELISSSTKRSGSIGLASHSYFKRSLVAKFLSLKNTKYLPQAMWLTASTSRYHMTEEEMKAEYEIIAKSQKNNRYFGPIYQKYYDSIFIFINRRLDDEEESADVTSIVFYKCLENLHKFKFQGVPFSAWLFRIAVSEINQFFRRKKKHDRAVSIKDHHISQLMDEIQNADDRDPHWFITRLLEQMNPDDIQFLELRFFEGHSFKEMGYLLGLTEVNAKIKTYRILKKLKELAKNL